ncbi:YLP motif-containing protein 1-like isoform X3 [Zophobas morio]|uniref:YLP motif-containing protein 1-like isoform X3 n=1 Tax=Zophobas morio TaxID=2755281 RepID=UPI00308379CB
MSWPQWSTTQASVPPVLNPATPVINSAPAVVPPGLQYTPEQWAQLQQQNWHQWAQWQQQYQQWHQQYGAEYQKSMNALAQAAQAQQASLPNVAVPPPLPVEVKPPPPAEDPPPPVPSYNTAPPPAPPQQGYNTATKASEQRPPVHYPKNNQNWQNQNYRYGQEKRPFEHPPDHDSKRPMISKPGWQSQPPPQPRPRENVEELSEAEKKFDKQFADWEAQFQKWKEQNAEHPDKEQYKEYEKRWESWRAQLLERREQMKRKRLGLPMDSPNRARPSPGQNFNQNQSFNSPQQGFVQNQGFTQPQNFSQPPPKVPQNMPPKQGLLPAPTPPPGAPGFNKPPPTMNDEPLKFKEGKDALEPEEVLDDFIKPNTGGGIPGLDLVKDDPKPPHKENDDVVVIDPEEKEREKKGPDFDAISKGINTILGDQKLLNMLSMVSQTQIPKQSDNLTNTVSRIKDAANPDAIPQHPPYPEQSNQSYEEHSNHSGSYGQREFVNNFDDQTRSSFTQAHNEEMRFEGPGNYNRSQSQFPDRFGNFKGNRFGGPDEQFNRGDRFQPGPDRFGPREDRYAPDDQYGPPEDNFPPNQDRFGPNQGRFGPNQDRFGPNQDRFAPNQDRFGPNQDRFGPQQDRFGPNQNRLGPNQDRLGPNQNRLGPNQDRLGPNQNRLAPNQDRLGPNQDRLGPNQDRLGPNQDRLGPNQDRFVSPNKDKFAPDQERFGPNPGRVGPNQDRFGGPNQDRFGGPNQDRVGGLNPGFGPGPDKFGPNRDRAGPNQDRFGPKQDRFGPNQDRFGPNQDRFAPNQDKFGPNKDRFLPNQDRLGPNSDRFGSGQDRFGPKQDRFASKGDDFNQKGPDDRFSGRNDRNLGPKGQYGYDDDNYNQGRFDDYKQGSQFEENYDDYDYDAVAASFENEEQSAAQKNKEQWKQEQNYQEPEFIEAPMEEEPEAPPAPESEEIFQAATVIDYEHKSSKNGTAEPEVLIEPIYMFDYRHKPLSRIPLPQRPKWLSDAVKNIREFDPPLVRPYEPNLRRYQPSDNWRNDRYPDPWPPHNRRNERPPFDERRSYNDNRYEDSRGPKNDWNAPKWEEKSYGEDRNFRSDDRRQPIKSMEFEEEKISDTEWPEDDELEQTHNQTNTSNQDFPSFKKPDESKPIKNIVLIEDLINAPGRYKRPPRMVIILRGPPGSGKTFLAKLIKDKEVENGGSAPRILSLDDYFMVEQEKEVTEEGKKVKVKDMVYEYEAEMEESYRSSLIKSFKKTITDGYFSFIIVDNINDKVKYFGEMWSFAKQNGFQVYICQLDLDVQTCSKRNIHGRSEADIEKCVANWEATPSHHPILDATSLLQSASIPEVEMEEVNSPESDVGENDGSEQNSMASTNRYDTGRWKSTSNWIQSGPPSNPPNPGRREFGGPIWKNRSNRRR